MKKKGFTLIELLAVIVVLAIIAVIAIPIITNVIEKARSSALKDSAYGLIEAANLYYATSITKGEDFDETTFNLVDGKLKSGSKELSYKGQSFKGSSYVAINEVGSVKLMITDGKYYASKEYDEVNITMSDSQDDALTIEELTSKVNQLENEINLLKEADININKRSKEMLQFNLTTISNDYYQFQDYYKTIYKDGYLTINILIYVKKRYTDSGYFTAVNLPPGYTVPIDYYQSVPSTFDSSGESLIVDVKGNIIKFRDGTAGKQYFSTITVPVIEN